MRFEWNCSVHKSSAYVNADNMTTAAYFMCTLTNARENKLDAALDLALTKW